MVKHYYSLKYFYTTTKQIYTKTSTNFYYQYELNIYMQLLQYHIIGCFGPKIQGIFMNRNATEYYFLEKVCYVNF